MKLNVLKPGTSRIQGAVWDIFELDTFNKQLGLLPEQIIEMLDIYSGYTLIPQAELELHVTVALYLRMGGSEKTPVNEVMAFMFVLLNSPNFRFPEFVKLMATAIHMDNTMKYLEETEAIVPSQYADELYATLNNNVILNILHSRHQYTVDTEMPKEEALAFTHSILQNVETYLNGSSATEEAFKDLFE
jgi:hypothetical protein